MASHHHHNHHHYQQQQQQQHSYPSCNGCCCNDTSSSFHPFPSPPPVHQSHLHTVVDPLIVQSIATQILQSSQNHLYTPQVGPQHLETPHKQQNQQQTRSILTSLLRRIDALESSLHNLSVSPSPPLRPRSLSLRDLAARTIQIHFRAFLVRRSRTLRNLKDLAFIKSSFNNLKSALSGNSTHLDSRALSQKAMDLLLKLDSVQGGDPMIRDGKRSISNELVRFLEFVDGISVKRQQISMRNVRLAEDNQKSRVFINRDQSSRRVAVADNISTDRRDLGSNKYRVYLKKVSDQDDQEIQGFSRVSEDDDEESQVEFDGFHPNNDQEEIPRNVNYGKGENSQAQNGISMKRQDLSLKPKKSVSFADNNGEVSRVFLSTQEPFSSEDGDSIDQLGLPGDDDQREFVEHLCREVEEIGGFSRVSEDNDEEEEEETQLEKRGLSQVSDGERNPREYVKTEVNRHFQSENCGFVFSPPKPVQMEPRKNLRIVR